MEISTQIFEREILFIYLFIFDYESIHDVLPNWTNSLQLIHTYTYMAYNKHEENWTQNLWKQT